MIETEPFEEATTERLGEADVIIAIGVGDNHAPQVLVGREKFVSASRNKAIAEETKTLRVRLASEEELPELIERVKEAKGELEPGVE